MGAEPQWPLVSVVIPARNEAEHIGAVVRSVVSQSSRAGAVEVIVLDDGSTDDTARLAQAAGARVIASTRAGEKGNCAAARNLGAAECRGDPIVFLDADCIAAPGWLEQMLLGHERGATVVGGSLDLPPGLPVTARCDYYCSWYLIHPRAGAGRIPHHPPTNLSVRREAFASTAGYATHPPFYYTNEERFWQGELMSRGHWFYFQPGARAIHHHHAGFGALLRRNYRWGYTAVEAKSTTGVARMAWLYRYPWLVVIASPMLVVAHTLFIVTCWLRARIFEPLALLPLIFASRLAYVSGMCAGAVRWMQFKRNPAAGAHTRRGWD
jgi:glycosyltransferase involved in cell wall biosynthesis